MYSILHTSFLRYIGKQNSTSETGNVVPLTEMLMTAPVQRCIFFSGKKKQKTLIC